MTKRDRLMLLSVLAVALLGGFWMLILSPQRKAAADAEAQVETARTQLSAAQQQLTSARTAEDAYRRDRTTVVKLGRVVPETDDIPTLITQLSALARKEKVEFNLFSISNAGAGDTGSSAVATTTDAPAGTTPSKSSTAAVAPLFPPGSVEIAGGLGRTPISIELKGRYFELERYLRAVQRFAVLSQKRSTSKGRLMVVDAFSYVIDEEEKNLARTSPDLKAVLSASVYFAPPLEVPNTGDAGGAASAPAPATPSTGSTTGPAAIGGIR